MMLLRISIYSWLLDIRLTRSFLLILGLDKVFIL
jgi:hypothetical protein